MKLVNQAEQISKRIGDEAAVRIICESGFDGLDYSMFCMSDDDCILNTSAYKKHVEELKKLAASLLEILLPEPTMYLAPLNLFTNLVFPTKVLL